MRLQPHGHPGVCAPVPSGPFASVYLRLWPQLIDSLDVPYETVDVLADPELREGLKVYSQWPTIPQLYVNGEFIGGCDIMVEAMPALRFTSIYRDKDQGP